MKGRPIRIDWDDLETAFNNRNEELVYYLDTVTGHVLLEGEGEESPFDDDEDLMDEGAATPAVEKSDTTRLYIEPPDSDVEIGWMRDFVAEASDLDAEVSGQLRQALEGEAPVEGFREALRDRAEERDRWFLYRSDQVHEYVESWLDANEIRPAETPPWK